MKCLPLALGALAVAVSGGPATARTTINVTSSAATTCFRAAEAHARSGVAIAQCSDALNEDRLDRDERVATLVNRGIVLMLANRPREAIRDFDDALALDANQPEAYLNKALTHLRIGNSADAQVLASRALELRTKKPAVAYYIRGLASEDRGDIRAAYAYLKRAAAIDPTWSAPQTELQRYHVSR